MSTFKHGQMTAETIMTKDVITAKPNSPVLDVLDIFIKHKITGLPVIGSDGDLVGIITEKDLLKLLLDDPHDCKTVRDYMTTNVLTFKKEDDIADICKFLIKNPIRRVPITDVEGKLVGVISRWDIIEEIQKIRGL